MSFRGACTCWNVGRRHARPLEYRLPQIVVCLLTPRYSTRSSNESYPERQTIVRRESIASGRSPPTRRRCPGPASESEAIDADNLSAAATCAARTYQGRGEQAGYAVPVAHQRLARGRGRERPTWRCLVPGRRNPIAVTAGMSSKSTESRPASRQRRGNSASSLGFPVFARTIEESTAGHGEQWGAHLISGGIDISHGNKQ